MSNNTKKAARTQLVDRANEIAARFPEVHEVSDCLETIRLVMELFDGILRVDGSEPAASLGLDPLSRDREPRYSIADAEKLSKELRALARTRGTKPVLSTWELVRRLAPELSALLEEGHTYPQLAQTLTRLGVDLPMPEALPFP
jgi:hypothetical protein